MWEFNLGGCLVGCFGIFLLVAVFAYCLVAVNSRDDDERV